jgi:MFS family permease
VATSAARASGLAMVLTCGAQFVLQLDFSIVNVALLTIQADLHMAAAQLQWVVTGYALTFGSLLLVGGRLADLLGRRRLLVIGLIIFAVASVACGLARWPVMLIVGCRSGGFCWPGSRAWAAASYGWPRCRRTRRT